MLTAPRPSAHRHFPLEWQQAGHGTPCSPLSPTLHSGFEQPGGVVGGARGPAHPHRQAAGPRSAHSPRQKAKTASETGSTQVAARAEVPPQLAQLLAQAHQSRREAQGAADAAQQRVAAAEIARGAAERALTAALAPPGVSYKCWTYLDAHRQEQGPHSLAELLELQETGALRADHIISSASDNLSLALREKLAALRYPGGLADARAAARRCRAKLEAAQEDARVNAQWVDAAQKQLEAVQATARVMRLSHATWAPLGALHARADLTPLQVKAQLQGGELEADAQLFPTTDVGVPQIAGSVVADWEAALAHAASCAQAASGKAQEATVRPEEGVRWHWRDVQGTQQGPYCLRDIRAWQDQGHLDPTTLLYCLHQEACAQPLSQLLHLPSRSDSRAPAVRHPKAEASGKLVQQALLQAVRADARRIVLDAIHAGVSDFSTRGVQQAKQQQAARAGPEPARVHASDQLPHTPHLLDIPPPMARQWSQAHPTGPLPTPPQPPTHPATQLAQAGATQGRIQGDTAGQEAGGDCAEIAQAGQAVPSVGLTPEEKAQRLLQGLGYSHMQPAQQMQVPATHSDPAHSQPGQHEGAQTAYLPSITPTSPTQSLMPPHSPTITPPAGPEPAGHPASTPQQQLLNVPSVNAAVPEAAHEASPSHAAGLLGSMISETRPASPELGPIQSTAATHPSRDPAQPLAPTQPTSIFESIPPVQTHEPTGIPGLQLEDQSDVRAYSAGRHESVARADAAIAVDQASQPDSAARHDSAARDNPATGGESAAMPDSAARGGSAAGAESAALPDSAAVADSTAGPDQLTEEQDARPSEGQPIANAQQGKASADGAARPPGDAAAGGAGEASGAAKLAQREQDAPAEHAAQGAALAAQGAEEAALAEASAGGTKHAGVPALDGSLRRAQARQSSPEQRQQAAKPAALLEASSPASASQAAQHLHASKLEGSPPVPRARIAASPPPALDGDLGLLTGYESDASFGTSQPPRLSLSPHLQPHEASPSPGQQTPSTLLSSHALPRRNTTPPRAHTPPRSSPAPEGLSKPTVHRSPLPAQLHMHTEATQSEQRPQTSMEQIIALKSRLAASAEATSPRAPAASPQPAHAAASTLISVPEPTPTQQSNALHHPLPAAPISGSTSPARRTPPHTPAHLRAQPCSPQKSPAAASPQRAAGSRTPGRKRKAEEHARPSTPEQLPKQGADSSGVPQVSPANLWRGEAPPSPPPCSPPRPQAPSPPRKRRTSSGSQGPRARAQPSQGQRRSTAAALLSKAAAGREGGGGVQGQAALEAQASVLGHAQKSLPRSAHFASPISERVKRQRTHKPKPPPPAQDPAAKQAGGKCKQFVQGPASRRLHLKPEVLAMGGGGNVVGGRGVTPSSEDSTTSTAALLASTLPMQETLREPTPPHTEAQLYDSAPRATQPPSPSPPVDHALPPEPLDDSGAARRSTPQPVEPVATRPRSRAESPGSCGKLHAPSPDASARSAPTKTVTTKHQMAATASQQQDGPRKRKLDEGALLQLDALQDGVVAIPISERVKRQKRVAPPAIPHLPPSAQVPARKHSKLASGPTRPPIHSSKQQARKAALQVTASAAKARAAKEARDPKLNKLGFGCARARVHREGDEADRKEGVESPRHRAKVASAEAAAPPVSTQPAGRPRSSRSANVAVSATDAHRYSQLKARIKNLRPWRSRVHGWGLVANEPIEANQFVIEYTGEIVRNMISDRREKAYDASGLGSCYMFRLDEERVVDATCKGGMARFINHSCDPNCHTKTVTIDGDKHIIIYSKRRIERGEELTYNYKFAYEPDEAAVPCYCGARNCRKRMN